MGNGSRTAHGNDSLPPQLLLESSSLLPPILRTFLHNVTCHNLIFFYYNCIFTVQCYSGILVDRAVTSSWRSGYTALLKGGASQTHKHNGCIIIMDT